ALRCRKHQGAGSQHFGSRTGIVACIWRALSHGDVARRIHKLAELRVCDGRSFYPETAYTHRMDGCLFGIVLIRAHSIGAAWNPGHAFSIEKGFIVALDILG